METVFTSNDYLTMFVLLTILIVLVFMVKYLEGDFSPISIEEIGREILENKSSDNVITKCVVVTYKKTYKDGRVKITHKTIY